MTDSTEGQISGKGHEEHGRAVLENQHSSRLTQMAASSDTAVQRGMIDMNWHQGSSPGWFRMRGAKLQGTRSRRARLVALGGRTTPIGHAS